MSNECIRYGILGTGLIADWLANGFAGCEDSELVAVASRSAEKAAEFARSHNISRHYGSYDALLDDADVTAVIIALPNSMHREWTVKAAQAGKHVLCEKPLAMTLADVNGMAQACEANGVLLMEAAMYRFQPQIAKVLEIVRSGRIGGLRLIRGAFCFPFKSPANIRYDDSLGGGCLYDMGFYPVDFSLLLAGEAPSRSACFARIGAENRIEEVAAGSIEFPSGTVALFESGFDVDIKTNADIIGQDATIQLPDPWTARGKEKEILIVKAREVVERITVPDPSAYTLEIDHFSTCIRTGASLLRSLDETRSTIALLEKLQACARA